MTHTLRNRLVAGALAGVVTLMVPGAAWAAPAETTTSAAGSSASGQASNPFCTPSTFTTAQQAVVTALSGRVTQLNALVAAVSRPTTHLTSSDQTTLLNDLNNVELPGIEALQPEAQSATDCIELRPIARQMVLDYRVYVVMTPQTHLTIALDYETFVEGVFSNLEPTITGAIATAKAQGRDVTAAQGAFNDLESQLTAAQSETNGLSATVLAQTPAGAPGNWQVFLDARTAATNARNDLRATYADLNQVVHDLGLTA